MSAKRHAPATARNREPILAVLQRLLPPAGRVLEIAAGSGEHAAFFAPRFPALEWQPTDLDDDNIASIAAWVEETGAANLRPPLRLDVTAWPWPVAEARVVFNANMIHISPWETTPGLMRGAGEVLAPGGLLVLYGPFRIGGAHVSDSNVAFDQWLKDQDHRWGVRDLEAVAEVAAEHGLRHMETVEMPANNRIAVFEREVERQ